MGSKSTASRPQNSKALAKYEGNDKKTNKKTLVSPDSQPVLDEVGNIWHSVKAATKVQRPTSAIIAVVPDGQVQRLQDKISERQYDATAFVATADDLQRVINQITPAKDKSKNKPKDKSKGKSSGPYIFKFLEILVSYAVDAITYNVPAVIERVNVDACKGSPATYKLRIGVRSTYCSVPAFHWFSQNNKLLEKHALDHSPKCYFDCSEDVEFVRELSFVQEQPIPTAEELGDIKEQFINFTKTNVNAKNDGDTARVSTAAGRSSMGHADGTETWFQQWKGVIAAAAGLGCAGAGFFTVGWVTAGGVFIKGPCGLAISAGYVHGAFAVGTAAAAATTAAGVSTVVVPGMIYFIPWGRVFLWLRRKLANIWRYVCDALCWVGEKIKELASYVIQQIHISFSGIPRPMRV